LALSFRTPRGIQFLITVYLPDTYLSKWSCRNWVRLAPRPTSREVPAASTAPLGPIGFVCTTGPGAARAAWPAPARHRAGGNWLCFSTRLAAFDSSQLFTFPILTAHNSLTEIGFVCTAALPPTTDYRLPTTAFWLCFAPSTPRLVHLLPLSSFLSPDYAEILPHAKGRFGDSSAGRRPRPSSSIMLPGYHTKAMVPCQVESPVIATGAPASGGVGWQPPGPWP
jgi:hypothetical protein